jgi:hypothetical protein
VFEKRKKMQKMGWGFWSKDVDLEVDEAVSPLDGIIAHLTQECGGNVAEQRVVRVTGSDVQRDHPEFAAKNAADLGSNSVFYSGSEPEQWLCYDFSDMVVIPTHYSIRAGEEMSPRNWIVESREWGGTGLSLIGARKMTRSKAKTRLPLSRFLDQQKFTRFVCGKPGGTTAGGTALLCRRLKSSVPLFGRCDGESFVGGLQQVTSSCPKSRE